MTLTVHTRIREGDTELVQETQGRWFLEAGDFKEEKMFKMRSEVE